MSDVITSKSGYVLFDMDGTLVETDFANFLAYQKAIKAVLKVEANIDFDPLRRFNAKLLQEYFPNLTKNQTSSVVQLKKQFYSEFLSETLLIPKTCERLRECSQNKNTILVTNSQSERALQTLRFHGLDKFFSGAYCANHRSNVEDKYQHVMRHLDARNQQVVVFENEEVEVAHALAAGVLAQNIVIV